MKKRILLASLLALPTLAFATRVDLTPAAKTRQSMKRIVAALEQYREFCGSVPTTEAGLAALEEPAVCSSRTHAPFLKPVERDGWGRFFVYESDGKTFKVVSFGRDGKEGGVGEDSDLVAQ